MTAYQTFFEISHDLFAILDKDGYYKEVNPAFSGLLGYSEDEMREHSFTFFLHPDDVENTVAEYKKVTEGQRNDIVDNRFRASDGTFHWISWSTIVQGESGDFYSSGQNISEHRRLAAALKKTQEENKRKVTKAIIQTQETERSKISQELHDNVNQVLTSVKLLMEICQNSPEQASGILNRATKLQQQAIDEIRSLSKRLSAPSLGNLKLIDSIRDLISAFHNAAKLHITLTSTLPEEVEIDQYLHLVLYRILQEHLTNVVKHAAASQVAVSLEQDDSKLVMTVSDDGVGFDTEKKGSGIGIQNMKTRAESTGGTMKLNSALGEGTSLIVHVPVGIDPGN